MVILIIIVIALLVLSSFIGCEQMIDYPDYNSAEKNENIRHRVEVNDAYSQLL